MNMHVIIIFTSAWTQTAYVMEQGIFREEGVDGIRMKKERTQKVRGKEKEDA